MKKKYRYVGMAGIVYVDVKRQIQLKYGDIVESENELGNNFELIEEKKKEKKSNAEKETKKAKGRIK